MPGIGSVQNAKVLSLSAYQILFVAFLGLYSYMILVEFSATLQFAEIAVYTWVLAFILLEALEVRTLEDILCPKSAMKDSDSCQRSMDLPEFVYLVLRAFATRITIEYASCL